MEALCLVQQRALEKQRQLQNILVNVDLTIYTPRYRKLSFRIYCPNENTTSAYQIGTCSNWLPTEAAFFINNYTECTRGIVEYSEPLDWKISSWDGRKHHLWIHNHQFTVTIRDQTKCIAYLSPKMLEQCIVLGGEFVARTRQRQ